MCISTLFFFPFSNQSLVNILLKKKKSAGMMNYSRMPLPLVMVHWMVDNWKQRFPAAQFPVAPGREHPPGTSLWCTVV